MIDTFSMIGLLKFGINELLPKTQGPTPPPPTPPVGLAIDQGMVFLISLTLVFGVIFLKKYRKKLIN